MFAKYQALKLHFRFCTFSDRGEAQDLPHLILSQRVRLSTVGTYETRSEFRRREGPVSRI